ncbi:uncharacterized protein A1O5_09118 [Cladophialophora psammophila CBS 110553]|uniref:Uncharacterized protein n=1 Tax=Cladophialophora psammophila CBS 110553 TaxID=1182543 RepID=W9WI22_9EURO|nr:uncharacterized protein A1O5_09118 [Cladophialophora psammophila CBS 110553]EXJ67772.1 hypothetical protein A1O5_09118 [Cladophialophora psammophila CBS 110553]
MLDTAKVTFLPQSSAQAVAVVRLMASWIQRSENTRLPRPLPQYQVGFVSESCLIANYCIMIRLPPSSLSISESDIDFHVRQTEIYQGLLRQGFKKEDIIRYLNDYRKTAADAVYPGLPGFDLSILSTTELSYLRPRPSPQESDQGEFKIESPALRGSSESTDEPVSCFPDLSGDTGEPQDNTPESLAHQGEDSQDRRPMSPALPVPTVHINRHAPRKSSLLRFAEAVSPERLSADPEEAKTVPAPMVTPIRRNYKRRSHTYPYQSSERDSVTDTLTQDHILDGINRISLDDTADSAPFERTPPLWTTARTQSAQDIMFASPVLDSPPGDGSADAYNNNPADRTLERRRSSDLLGHMYSITDMSSSPPLPMTPARDDSEQQHASPSSTQLPITPTPIRNAAALPRTEPRPSRHRYPDGNVYTVYNDSFPASSQPQTPADISRYPLITEQDAAYTAPPGMLRIGSASVSYHGREGWDQEAAQQSPTARAISLRDRRNRELMRSVRAAGVRLQRLRIRDESRFTQQALQGDDAANGRTRAETFPLTSDDMWRDELEADRVGEENFEAGNEARVMRVVSGNARFHFEG